MIAKTETGEVAFFGLPPSNVKLSEPSTDEVAAFMASARMAGNDALQDDRVSEDQVEEIFRDLNSTGLIHQARSHMAKTFNEGLPDEIAIQFTPVRLAIESMLDGGRVDRAIAYLQGVNVTEDVQPYKDQFLTSLQDLQNA